MRTVEDRTRPGDTLIGSMPILTVSAERITPPEATAAPEGRLIYYLAVRCITTMSSITLICGNLHLCIQHAQKYCGRVKRKS